MTEQEFIAINPAATYGSGQAGLLYSSSVVNPGIDDTPVAPFYIQGLTLPNRSKSGVDITEALKQVNKFTFDVSGSQVTSKVTARQVKSGYTFFRLSQIAIDKLPTTEDINSNPIWNGSEFIFFPFLGSNFNTSDFNPLMNNSETSRRNKFKSRVDRNDSQFVPSNLTAIVAGTAEQAELQHSNYTDSGLVNARYDGVTETSGSSPYDDPAIAVRFTKGSIHPLGADDNRIAGADLLLTGSMEKDPQSIYFRVDRTPTSLVPSGTEYISGSNQIPNLKSIYGRASTISGSILYEEIEGRLTRITSQKVFIEESGEIFVTNDRGIAISSTTP